MGLIVAGVSHRTAPLALRERLVVSASETDAAAHRILKGAQAREIVLLSTCNRTEVYAVEGDADPVPSIWASFSALLGEDAAPYGYVRRDRDAVAHLFHVTAGIDSMILGEAQIHGQVRDAWERSRSASGAVLSRLFQTALMVAGRVRSETGIGRGAASTSSAAVQLASKIFGSLNGRHAMVLGAGGDGGARTRVPRERGRAHGDRCESYARARDIIGRAVSCGGAALRRVLVAPAPMSIYSFVRRRHHIRSSESKRSAVSLKERGDRPLCILDIAVPRDVEPAVGSLSNVFLYDLDDLRTVASSNIERRREELPAVEEVIAPEVEKYWEWLAGLAAVPVLRTFRTENGPAARSGAGGMRCASSNISRHVTARRSNIFRGH